MKGSFLDHTLRVKSEQGFHNYLGIKSKTYKNVCVLIKDDSNQNLSSNSYFKNLYLHSLSVFRIL